MATVEAVLGGPLAEWLGEEIPRLARFANSRWRRIPAQDYEQEMWARSLELKDRFREQYDRGEYGFIKRRLKDATAMLRQEDDRYVRACKALDGGYSTADEAFYSTSLLARLLPALIAVDWDIAAAVQRASGGTDAAGVHIGSGDPAAAGNYEIMLIDIRKGWEALTEGQRRLLAAYHAVRQDDTEDGRWERQQLASSMGLTANALYQRVHRALEALQEQLGGADPW
jgi:hypothetical protein